MLQQLLLDNASIRTPSDFTVKLTDFKMTDTVTIDKKYVLRLF